MNVVRLMLQHIKQMVHRVSARTDRFLHQFGQNVGLWLRILPRYYFERYVWRTRIKKPPIFIVGSPHSGTSLLLALLGAHPAIFAIPYESDLAFKSEETRRKILRRFDRLAIAHGKERWVEKTPRHLRKIDTLLQLCPGARIIVIVRDGRDVVCSLKARRGRFERGVERWVRDGQLVREYKHHAHVYLVRYEDIVDDAEQALLRVTAFLAEDYEPSMLEYHKTRRRFYSRRIEKPPSPSRMNHDQHRNWQINQPIFDGRGRWKQELTVPEKRIFMNLAGSLLAEYGYESNPSW